VTSQRAQAQRNWKSRSTYRAHTRYDLAGNRTAPRGPATYNANEQLLQDATYDYAYDLEGNMISRTLRSDPSEVTSYAWDAEHRLIEVQLPDLSHVTYRYDPLGNRIEIAHGSDIKRYVYDEGQIVAEYDGANDLVATFVHTPSGHSPLEMERDGQRYCHVVDAQGSTTALVDMSGAIVERNRYDTFGNHSATANHGNPFTFTGVLRDSATNLYLMPLRAYDPTIGRFLSEDPIAAPNLYPYANNNPTNLIDPSGAAAVAERGIAGATINAIMATSVLVMPLGRQSNVVHAIAWQSTCLLTWGGSKIAMVAGLSYSAPSGFEMCAVDCKKASAWHLRRAGIDDEHKFKDRYDAKPNSRFEICACNDRSIRIKLRGTCGRSGPSTLTDATW